MPNPTVPAAEVQKLLAGSFEQKSREILQAAQHNVIELFGEAVDVAVLSTFPDYAILMTPDGRFARVMYEHDSSGGVQIVGSEMLNVPLIGTAEERRRYARACAVGVVEALLQGDVKGARIGAASLFDLVEGDRHETDHDIVQAIIESLHSARSWRRTLDESGEDIPEAPEPRFARLVDGSVPPARMEGYRGLVRKELDVVRSRLESVVASARSSFARLTELTETNPERVSDPAVVELRAFASDLVAGLEEVQASVEKACAEVSHIPALAELHDALAEELVKQETAGELLAALVAALPGN